MISRTILTRSLPALAAATLVWACATGSPVTAEESTAEAAPRPCQATEFRQFDFWIGNWEVRVAAGKKAGDNLIQSVNGGCALTESYLSVGGYRGQSVNIYDASRGVWHQTWVDNSGLLLTIEGGWQDGSMVLTGTRGRKTPQGEVLDRISWTPRKDGTVRQVWSVSPDGGETFKVIFDGIYHRKPMGADTPQS